MVNQHQENEQAKARQSNRNLILGLWLVVGVFLLGKIAYVFLQDAPNPCGDGVVIAGKSEMLNGDFEAVNENGAVITKDDIFQDWSLVYFGYSFCPDVCPIDNARNAEITDILNQQGIEITPIFITVDPARDTPEVMKTYTEYIHPKMIGVSGSEAQIERLKSLFKAYSEKVTSDSGDDPDYYLVNHTAFSYLVNDGAYVTAYSRSQRAEEIAANISCQVQNR